PLGVVARSVLVASEVRAPVVVELRAWPARAGRPGLPEVVRAAQMDDPPVRHADRVPARDGLLVRAEAELLVAAEHGHPDALRIEPEVARGQLPGVFDRLLLEVVAKGEVAQHLEEGQVSSRLPDLLDVRGSEALLAGREPRIRRRLLAAEIGLERLHPSGGEQHRRVEGGRHDRRRWHPPMVAHLEEREVALPNLCGLHAASVTTRKPGPRGSKTRNQGTGSGP